MKRCLFFALLLLSGCDGRAAFGQAPATPVSNVAFKPDFFVLEIRGLEASLKRKTSPAEIAAFREALPSNWTVVTPEHTYSISTQPLRNQLASSSTEKALAWMDHLAEEINKASDGPSEKVPNARAELNRILAQLEFAAVRPPSAWDLFKQRLTAWLERMLGKLFVGMGRYPIAGKFLFWIIVTAGVLGIALWLFRFLVGRDRLDSLQQAASIVNTRTWQEYIRAARDAAGRGDFREAVHSAYWAGIVRLEDLGVVPKDRSKTPREYLRSVTDPKPGELASGPPIHREPLTALTLRFERVWYANRGASHEDFQESLRQLEALGCHLE